MKKGNIPVLNIVGRTIPEVYEKALRMVWKKGARIKTEYDKPEDPASRDATVAITILEPFGQPRFHRSFADGLGALGEYVMEVIFGAHDYWIKPIKEVLKGDKSKDTKWTYTYHQRLFNYLIEGKKINQIDYLVSKLAQTGHSRRAQAITWNTRLDPPTSEPPCLQRIWARICQDEQGGLIFNMNTHWRSRDLFKAWFENVIAITGLMRKIADMVSEKIDKPIKLGRYVDISDSLHIYGSYFSEIEGDSDRGVKSFFENLESRSFEKRTWHSDFVKPFFINDGTGKGLEPMLGREKDMPAGVRTAIQNELELMKQDDYVV